MQDVKHQTKKKQSKTLARLLKMVFVRHKFKLILVLIFMMIATFANVYGLSTLQKVLDEALLMFETSSNDFSGVIQLILTMVGLYLLNIVKNKPLLFQ